MLVHGRSRASGHDDGDHGDPIGSFDVANGLKQGLKEGLENVGKNSPNLLVNAAKTSGKEIRLGLVVIGRGLIAIGLSLGLIAIAIGSENWANLAKTVGQWLRPKVKARTIWLTFGTVVTLWIGCIHLVKKSPVALITELVQFLFVSKKDGENGDGDS